MIFSLPGLDSLISHVRIKKPPQPTVHRLSLSDSTFGLIRADFARRTSYALFYFETGYTHIRTCFLLDPAPIAGTLPIPRIRASKALLPPSYRLLADHFSWAARKTSPIVAARCSAIELYGANNHRLETQPRPPSYFEPMP